MMLFVLFERTKLRVHLGFPEGPLHADFVLYRQNLRVSPGFLEGTMHAVSCDCCIKVGPAPKQHTFQIRV